MANQATLATLTTSVRRRLNLVNMNTVSDAEVQEFLRDALAALYEMMVSKWRDYYVYRHLYTLEVNRENYPLPDDFRACVSVWITAQPMPGATPRRFQLQVFNLNEFNSYPADYTGQLSWPSMYRIMGNSIYFSPIPSSSQVNGIEMWYVPQWHAPTLTTQPVDLALPNGWETFVMLEACCTIAARLRFVEMYQMYSAERDKAMKRVETAMAIRDETAYVMVNQFDSDGSYFNRNFF